MKKSLFLIAAVLLTGVTLAGCGQKKQADSNTITVGASAMPHAEILKHIQPELKKEGVNLKIKLFSD